MSYLYLAVTGFENLERFIDFLILLQSRKIKYPRQVAYLMHLEKMQQDHQDRIVESSGYRQNRQSTDLGDSGALNIFKLVTWV